jgi:hypothetical protein
MNYYLVEKSKKSILELINYKNPCNIKSYNFS